MKPCLIKQNSANLLTGVVVQCRNVQNAGRGRMWPVALIQRLITQNDKKSSATSKGSASIKTSATWKFAIKVVGMPTCLQTTVGLSSAMMPETPILENQ